MGAHETSDRLITVDTLGTVAICALAMAIVKASVASYLRKLFAPPDGTLLGVSRFSLRSAHLGHEQVRELVTVVMLLAVYYLAARCRRQRVASLLLALGIWDLGYHAVRR